MTLILYILVPIAYLIITLTMFITPSINADIGDILKNKNYKLIYYIATLFSPITLIICIAIFIAILVASSLDEFTNKKKYK